MCAGVCTHQGSIGRGPLGSVCHSVESDFSLGPGTCHCLLPLTLGTQRGHRGKEISCHCLKEEGSETDVHTKWFLYDWAIKNVSKHMMLPQKVKVMGQRNARQRKPEVMVSRNQGVKVTR